VTSPLEKLSGPGKSLKAEPPDTKEFEGLKRSGHDADLEPSTTFMTALRTCPDF